MLFTVLSLISDINTPCTQTQTQTNTHACQHARTQKQYIQVKLLLPGDTLNVIIALLNFNGQQVLGTLVAAVKIKHAET